MGKRAGTGSGKRVGLYLAFDVIEKMGQLCNKLRRKPSSLISWLIDRAWDEEFSLEPQPENEKTTECS